MSNVEANNEFIKAYKSSQETQKTVGIAMLTDWQKLNEHLQSLDESLKTINHYTEEGKAARMYVVGQIDALRWAIKVIGHEEGK
jgi:hypothetical protein